MRAAHNLATEEGRMQQLAEDLRMEPSSETVLKRLKALTKALSNGLMAHSRADIFVGSGGLPTVIRLLRGPASTSPNLPATTDAESLRSAISAEAGHALGLLVSTLGGAAQLASDDSVFQPLIDALRDAPSFFARAGACHALVFLARGSPAKRKALARAGTMGALLTLSMEAGDVGVGGFMWRSVWGLAYVLLCLEKIARRDLRQAICGPQADQAFTALVVLKQCWAEGRGLGIEGDLGPALKNDGIFDAVVAMLDHESPYCVAAAAAVFAPGQMGDGDGLTEFCQPIPALVRVIERASPPAELKTTGLYGWRVVAVELSGTAEDLGYNNPTCVAIAALTEVGKSVPLLDSFLEAGGVPALVRLLSEPTCPITANFAASSIISLLNTLCEIAARPDKASQLADDLLEAGLCQATVQALSIQATAVRGTVLLMLYKFCECLSDRSRPAAMEQLVAGNAVKLTIDLMAEAELDIVQPGLHVFIYFFKDPAARERLCDLPVAEQIMQWAARWLPKADLQGITGIMVVLSPLIAEFRPDPVPPAIAAILTPALVRAVCELQKTDPLDEVCCFCMLGQPIACLYKCLRGDTDNTRGLWRPAINAVPLFINLLTRGHEWLIALVVDTSELLLVPAPKGEVGLWGVELLRAVAQLLGAAAHFAQLRNNPLEHRGLPNLLAPRSAARMLYNVGRVHPELFVDSHTWGLEKGVRQLTKHSDPDTAAAARRLKDLLTFLELPHKVPDGPSQPTCPTPNAAGSLDPTPPGSDNRPNTKADTCGRQKEQPSVARVPKSRGEQISRTGASPRGCKVDVRACARCGITADQMRQAGKEVSEKGNMKECSGCRSVRYCGTACQKADWPAHTATCRRLNAAAQ